ncbi:MAG: ARMT1-like domain-containing protein, partial [Candidatus Solibacter sp.]|nr:ARMT1-like domain-containing protein [Candidatus Solibacter sp.]
MSAEGRRAIRSLTTDSIQRNLRHFLCDDSAGPDAALAILSRADFVPDTFTVADRLNGRAPLSGAEPTGIDWMREIVCGELDRMRESGALEAGAEPGLEDACAAETARFLACRHHDAPIAESITNQELPDVVRRIIAYCLFGDPAKELDTHQRFNTIGFELASRIIEDHMLRSNPSTKELLAYSIAAGLIGLDLKGAAAAASGFSVEGIRLAGVADRAVRNTAGPVWAELQRIARAGLAVDHWDTFAAEIAASNRRLVWFTDDYIESLFDLVLMQRLLVEYSGLSILLVPKKGRHANDLAYEDVDRFLESPWLQPLARERSTGRFQACPHGPRMGTVNLRKLSPELVRELAGDVTVYVKGCRAHELIQGGLNRISYTA